MKSDYLMELDKLKQLYFAALEGSEQSIQNFFEEYSEVFPLPFYIGHHLQWDALISKFPLDTSLVTDFIYVTRTSNHFLVVLVELESANKRIFTPKDRHIAIGPEFSTAHGQVLGWKDYIERNREAVLSRLSRMMTRGHWEGKVEFKYVLLYGREAEFENREDRKKRFNSFSTEEIKFVTYDSVWGRFEQSQTPRRRHILRLVKDKFTFKVLAYPENPETHIFAWLGPDRFQVSSEHKKVLMADGYEIEAWEQGKLLSLNCRKWFRPEAIAMPHPDFLGSPQC